MAQTLIISPKASEFIETVLRLHPKLAVFDCDGTLWAPDAGEGFLGWEIKTGLVSDEIVRWAGPRYADYKAGSVDEETMCGEMVTMHRGLKDAEVQKAASQYFDEYIAPAIFSEMCELIRRLHESDTEIWAVSSSNLWVIRAGMKHCGIPQERILAACVQVENGLVTDRLVRIPTGPGKTKAIQEVIGRAPDAAFGNSRWDQEMLHISRHPFAVNPNPDLEKIARQQGWPVYWPDGL